MREGRVLSCRRPAMPSFMNRSCQRQTQVFDLPVRRMIWLVPTPSALERMIAARQACFCEALRSLVIASSRPRTDRVIVMEIPVRMRQTRTATETEESQSGLFCQAKTTSRDSAKRSAASKLGNDVTSCHATRACMGELTVICCKGEGLIRNGLPKMKTSRPLIHDCLKWVAAFFASTSL